MQKRSFPNEMRVDLLIVKFVFERLNNESNQLVEETIGCAESERRRIDVERRRNRFRSLVDQRLVIVTIEIPNDVASNWILTDRGDDIEEFLNFDEISLVVKRQLQVS